VPTGNQDHGETGVFPTERRCGKMITEEIRNFIAGTPVAFVASTNEAGDPHLAAGRDIRVLDAVHLEFENWFCPTTLRNIARNPRVAVAVTTADGGSGFQFSGVVSRTIAAAMLDGYAPESEAPGMPQSLTRLVVTVEKVMAFSAGAHTDLALGEGA
jgi:predicted pyridoxine 5'-phosphate oxidase superfamily flavin-nucleotide-binding protein